MRGTGAVYRTYHGRVTSIGIQAEEVIYYASERNFRYSEDFWNIREGETYDFTPDTSGDGPRAVDVRPLWRVKEEDVIGMDIADMNERGRGEIADAPGVMFTGTVTRKVKKGVIVEIGNDRTVLVPENMLDVPLKEIEILNTVHFRATDVEEQPIDDPNHPFPRDEYAITSATVVRRGEGNEGNHSDPFTTVPCQQNLDQPLTVILWHDFDREKGVNGSRLSQGLNEAWNHMGKLFLSVKTGGSYAGTMTNLAEAKQHGHYVEKLIIATHGTEGQLWLGDANNPLAKDTMGHGKRFKSPEEVGSDIKSVLNAGLKIVICSCDLAAQTIEETHSHEILHRFAAAAEAQVVAAATDTVYFSLNPQTKKHNAYCEEGEVYIFQPGQNVKKSKGNQLPLYC